MEESLIGKIFRLFLEKVAIYIGWVVTLVAVVIWLFFPGILEEMKMLVLFWGPLAAVILSLVLALTKNAVKARRDESRGVYNYEISVDKLTFYLVDLIIYGGAVILLFLPRILGDKTINSTDLIQVLIYLGGTHLIKAIFYNKVEKDTSE